MYTVSVYTILEMSARAASPAPADLAEACDLGRKMQNGRSLFGRDAGGPAGKVARNHTEDAAGRITRPSAIDAAFLFLNEGSRDA